MKYPSEKDDRIKFDKNNVAIALNVLYTKKEKIWPAYVSKHNSNREKQVILLMILNGEKQCEAKSDGHVAKSEGRRRWHYFAVKKLTALLRGITSKHQGDFYCLNCFHSFGTKSKLQSHKRVCENKDF